MSYINAGKGLPILFEFEVGAIDRGAPISFLSQFPGEDEILIPAMSFLEVTGPPFAMDTDKGSVTVYPARVNCNLKSQTIEQIEARRRTELLAQQPYLVEEFGRDYTPVYDAFEWLQRKDFNHWVKTGHRCAEDSGQKLREMWKTLGEREAAWYVSIMCMPLLASSSCRALALALPVPEATLGYVLDAGSEFECGL